MWAVRSHVGIFPSGFNTKLSGHQWTVGDEWSVHIYIATR